MKILAEIISVLVFIFALSGNGETAQSRGQVSFLPQWLPQAQFAGYYVAFEKGFYEKYGLDVNILRGGSERPPVEWVKKGAADFISMFLSTAIVEWAKGNRLVNLGQIVSKSSQVLVAKKSSGINSLRDINGRKAGLWRADLNIMPTVLFKKYGLHVIAIPQASTVNLFLRGGVDVVSAMWYNEYHTILNSGVEPEELTVFNLSDFGFNVPEDGIYCLESTFKKDPESCRLFVLASLEGWRYACEHREEALDIVMKYVREANIATNRQHQKWMLDHMCEVIDPQGPNGCRAPLKESDFMAVARELVAGGLIDSIPAFSDFFKGCGALDEK